MQKLYINRIIFLDRQQKFLLPWFHYEIKIKQVHTIIKLISIDFFSLFFTFSTLANPLICFCGLCDCSVVSFFFLLFAFVFFHRKYNVTTSEYSLNQAISNCNIVVLKSFPCTQRLLHYIYSAYVCRCRCCTYNTFATMGNRISSRTKTTEVSGWGESLEKSVRARDFIAMNDLCVGTKKKNQKFESAMAVIWKPFNEQMRYLIFHKALPTMESMKQKSALNFSNFDIY